MSGLLDLGYGPVVSVIIPSRFRVDLLILCVRSVIQHASVRIEIIVIDDGSESGLISKAMEPFPEVKCFRNEIPQGFAKAVQKGIEAASGEVVHLLNDDTRVEVGWLDRPLACFADFRVGAVSPLVLIDDGRPCPSIDSAGDGYSLAGRAFKRFHRQPMPESMSGCWVFGASGSSAFYRKSALEAVGGFPIEFGAYFEDVEVSWRLQRAGWRIWFAPESVVWHKVTSSYSSIMSYELMKKIAENQELVFLTNMPTSYYIVTLPLHSFYLLGRFIRALYFNRSASFVAGLLGAWKQFLLKSCHSEVGGRGDPRSIPLELM
jgi:GT2 family glycosyltransferase